MRRLKEQGELSELWDDEGPGGEALPDVVSQCMATTAFESTWITGCWFISSPYPIKQARAADEEEAKRCAKELEETEKEKEEDATGSTDATVEATVVSTQNR